MAERTFRDEIAMFALERLQVEKLPQYVNQPQVIKNLARTAYAVADAMMEARAATQPKDQTNDQ